MKGGRDCLCLLSPGRFHIEQFVTNCVGERLPCNYLCVSSIGVREGILLGGRKKFALKITIFPKNTQFALKLTFYFNPNGA